VIGIDDETLHRPAYDARQTGATRVRLIVWSGHAVTRSTGIPYRRITALASAVSCKIDYLPRRPSQAAQPLRNSSRTTNNSF
jgi:hypothetical protein